MTLMAISPARTHFRTGISTWLGYAIGLALPIIAATIYPTYFISMPNPRLEITRQLGHIWMAGETVLIFYARRRGFSIRETWRVLPGWVKPTLLLFLATFWISSAFVSAQPGFSMALTVGWGIQLAYAAALAHLIAPVPLRHMDRIWHGFAAGLIALAAVIAVHFTCPPLFLRGAEHKIDWGNAIPGFISVRLFGSWAAAILALLTGVAWRSEQKEERQTILFLATALAFGMMFWTGTRAAVLGWLCVLPVAWLLAGPPRSRAAVTYLPCYFILAAIIAVALQPYGHPSFSFSDIFDPATNASMDGISSGRLTLWKRALKVYCDYPLLGSGAGSSWWLVPLDGNRHVQPHNALVQFLLNWGLIPTIPAVALLFGGTWRAHRAARRRPPLLPFVLMLDCLLIMSIFDGMLHFAQFILLIVSCFAICLAPRDVEAGEKEAVSG